MAVHRLLGPLEPELHRSQAAACILALVPSGCFRAGDNLHGSCVVTEPADDPPVAAVVRCFEEG